MFLHAFRAQEHVVFKHQQKQILEHAGRKYKQSKILAKAKGTQQWGWGGGQERVVGLKKKKIHHYEHLAI